MQPPLYTLCSRRRLYEIDPFSLSNVGTLIKTLQVASVAHYRLAARHVEEAVFLINLRETIFL